jgi:8-oxo-dGTP pyrophosphatase MutT (NUDIX family)
MDAGETPPEAALRELAEETGLSCAPADLIPLGYFAPEASTIAARGGMFVALNCTGTLRPAEDEIGLGELHLFGRDELADVVARGEIEDVGTLITYYRYLAWMARQGGERG